MNEVLIMLVVFTVVCCRLWRITKEVFITDAVGSAATICPKLGRNLAGFNVEEYTNQ